VKLQCVRMELAEPDASGRRRPVAIKDSEFTEDYDTVIAAIGQMPDVPESFKIATERGNRLKVIDDNSVTISEGVFAGGDAVTGPASIISAIATGRKGAIAIDKYLGGSGIIDEELAPVEEPESWLGCGDKELAHRERQKTPCLPLEQRLGNFSEVEHGYDKASAIKEAQRCLQCDLRLKISPVKFPPKRATTKGSQQE
jgi:formate dehydrogenase beta subunit